MKMNHPSSCPRALTHACFFYLIDLPLAQVNSKSFFSTQLKHHFLNHSWRPSPHQGKVSVFSLLSSWNLHFLQSSYFNLWGFFLNYLTNSKIDLYLVYSSMNLNMWIDLCNHHFNQETEHFYHHPPPHPPPPPPKKKQKTPLHSPFVVRPSHPLLWQTTDLFPILSFCLFQNAV